METVIWSIVGFCAFLVCLKVIDVACGGDK